MADLTLTQAEADALIEMEKHRVNDEQHDFPWGGNFLVLPLQSANKREQFVLDIIRGRINLFKGKYQNRGRQVIILVRLDVGGPSHRNPDDEEIPCPHLHLYREGYGDKWATPIPEDKFSRINDLFGTLEDFMRFCNITQPPWINQRLF